MAEKIFSNALKKEKDKIRINEKLIYRLGLTSARITNALILAVVKACSGQPLQVSAQYNGGCAQAIDQISPKKENGISINITDELNYLNQYALQNSDNYEHDGSIVITFSSDITLADIDLYVEYSPEHTITADVNASGAYNEPYTYDRNGRASARMGGKENRTAFGNKNGAQIHIGGSADGQESSNTKYRTIGLPKRVINGETMYNCESNEWETNMRVKIAGTDFSISIEYSDDPHNAVEFTDIAAVNKTDVNGSIVKQTVKYCDTSAQSVEKNRHKTGILTKAAIDIGGENKYNINNKYNRKCNIVKEIRDGQIAFEKQRVYTADNELQRITYTINGKTLEYTYKTNRTYEGRNAKIGLPCRSEQVINYDGTGRTKEISLGRLVKDIYYVKYGDYPTNRINSVWYRVNGVRKDNIKYTYDKAGNIETITENGKLVVRYVYDGLNRLVREDNVHFGTSICLYDNSGNILNKYIYAYTLSETLGVAQEEQEYAYNQRGSKRRLLSCNGERFAYNELGDPVVYRDRRLTWRGRRLLKYSYDRYYAYFTYDVAGERTRKYVVSPINTTESKYVYDGNRLIAEQRNGAWIYYYYGAEGVAGFEYDNNTYVYRKNLQGDVTHIYRQLSNDSFYLVAQYVYDAWGDHDVLDNEDEIDDDPKSIGNINSLRYRSYYYDAETNLYYLDGRYYDPKFGRFISADSSVEYLAPKLIGGLNLYAYCENNPIMRTAPKVKSF